jgi:hypothetical protein
VSLPFAMTSASILSLSAAAAHSWSLLASASAWRAASRLRHSSMWSSTRCTTLSIIDVRRSLITYLLVYPAAHDTIFARQPMRSRTGCQRLSFSLCAPPFGCLLLNLILPRSDIIALIRVARLRDQN